MSDAGGSPRCVTTRRILRKPPTNDFKRPQVVSMRSASYDGGLQNKPSTQRRYQRSERALAASLQKHPSETSPRELQIRVLQQATSMLSLHAEEARARAEALRIRIAKSNSEPPELAALQPERWMLEHRESAIIQDAEIAQKCLSNLLSLPSGSGIVDDALSEPESGINDPEWRHRANLRKFFKLSQTLKPIEHRTPRPPYILPLKRMTSESGTGMQLRPNLDLRLSHFNYQRPSQEAANQLNTPYPAPPSSPSFTQPLPTASPSINILDTPSEAEDLSSLGDDSHTYPESQPSSPDSSIVSLPLLTPPQPPPLSVACPSADSCVLPNPASRPYDAPKGTATIYRPLPPVLPSGPLVDLKLPDYARTLLDEFSATRPPELPLSPVPESAAPSATPTSAIVTSPSSWTSTISFKKMGMLLGSPSKDKPPPTGITSPKSHFIVPATRSSSLAHVPPPTPPKLPRPRTGQSLQTESLFIIPEARPSYADVPPATPPKSPRLRAPGNVPSATRPGMSRPSTADGSSVMTSPKPLVVSREARSSTASFASARNTKPTRPRTSGEPSLADFGFSEVITDQLSATRSHGPLPTQKTSWAARMKERMRSRSKV